MRIAAAIAILLLPGAASAQLSDEAAQAARKLIVVVSGTLGETESLGAGIIVGTGFDQVYIATANHVVRQGTQQIGNLRVRFWWLPGQSFPGEVLEDNDSTLDVAVVAVRGLKQLGIAGDTLPFTRLGDVTALKRGAPVYSVGHPRGTSWRIGVTPDRVSETSSDTVQFESTVLFPGHSGGALIDESGRIVGLIRRDLQPDGEAVRIDRLIERLRGWRYPVLLKPDAKPAPSPAPPATTTPPAVTTPPAGATTVIGGLDATVSGIRFFESVSGFPPVPSRVYGSRFASRGTQYINWELNLSHRAPQKRRDFVIKAVWLRPNGERIEEDTPTWVETTWADSQHWAGWGSVDGNYFEPGTYRVDLFVEGQHLTSGTFEVYAGEAPPLMYIQSIDAKVSEPLRFFEGPYDSPPKAQRAYRTRFPRNGTRYIYWELNLTYPAKTEKAAFDVRQVWTRPDGSNERDETTTCRIESGWTSSFHDSAWGRQEGGIWSPGTYRVDIFAEKRLVASATFVIE